MTEPSNQAAVMINGQWLAGEGEPLLSHNPLDDSLLWQGQAASPAQVSAAVAAARTAWPAWCGLSLIQRMDYVERYVAQLQAASEALALLICRENGKALWDARTEVAAMIGKAAISLRAYNERSGSQSKATAQGELLVRHKPHGVLAVFGPFNFPGHLPNGHIIPALLAGNTVVFKPSELTPAVACLMTRLWQQAGLPAGVLNLVCGERSTGAALAQEDDIDGLLFTGSAATGQYLHEQFAGQPHKVLALEMGGNNPLIVEPVQDLDAALYTTLFSAFVSSGQRCTCARRLLLPQGDWGTTFIKQLQRVCMLLPVAPGEADPQPFMAALVSGLAVQHLQQGLASLQAAGGQMLLRPRSLNASGTLMTPALIDMSAALPRDEELFGPILQIQRYGDLDEAIALANNTRFGLAAGLISDQPDHFDDVWQRLRAGIVNFNKPLTGASSEAPFGGVGASGNQRPSAYYAADYCAYPVATLKSDQVTLPETLPPGMTDVF